MRRIVSLGALVAVVVSVQAEKPQLTPYGFLKGDVYYAGKGVTSWYSSNPTAVTTVPGGGEASLAFSAAHSRFGLNGSVEVGEATIGGKLELDFFSANTNTNTNANPRMRQAYAWAKVLHGLEIRTGQQWDIFSPLNPTTNNTNANLWFAGNYGFRRPMMQLLYTFDFGSVVPCIQISAGEGTPEDDTESGGDNSAVLPLIQGRLSAKVVEKFTVGFSAVYGAFDKDRENTTNGISVDVAANLHQLFALKGEFCYGSDLANAKIFTIGGAGGGDTTVTNIGFWANVTSKPLDFLHVVAGIAREGITSTLAEGNPESNFSVYGDLIVPIGGHFSLCGEYQYLITTNKGEEGNGVGIMDISGKVIF